LNHWSILVGGNIRGQLPAVNDTTRPLDGVEQGIFETEVLQKSDNVREALMEGRRVRTSGIAKVTSNTIQDRVGGFMDDDVVGETGENQLTRQIWADVKIRSLKVTKKKGTPMRIVKSVGFLHGVREDREQAVQRVTSYARGIRPPMNLPTKSPFKSADGVADDRVDHLLVKSGIGFGRRQTVLSKDGAGIQIHAFVVATVRAVVVDNSYFASNRPLFEFFKGNKDSKIILKTSAS
jgi:hypothetical protein